MIVDRVDMFEKSINDLENQQDQLRTTSPILKADRYWLESKTERMTWKHDLVFALSPDNYDSLNFNDQQSYTQQQFYILKKNWSNARRELE